MNSWISGWESLWRERRAHKETRRAYRRLVVDRAGVLDRLEKAHVRIAALERDVTDREHEITDLEGRLALSDAEVIDLTRTNEALVDGLRWFDGSNQ